MHRRDFLASTFTLSAAAAAGVPMSVAQPVSAPESAPAPREFYELRRYHLTIGPQTALAEAFFTKALIPALNRLTRTSFASFSCAYAASHVFSTAQT